MKLGLVNSNEMMGLDMKIQIFLSLNESLLKKVYVNSEGKIKYGNP